MTLLLAVITFNAALSSSVTPAAFVVTHQGPLPSRPVTSASAPPAIVPDAPDTPSMVAPAPHRFSNAQGFGTQVPLAFAVRQIVPAGVSVTYGPDISPDALVDWAGGRPWNRVLQTAVAPLGWHAYTGRKSVRIMSE